MNASIANSAILNDIVDTIIKFLICSFILTFVLREESILLSDAYKMQLKVKTERILLRKIIEVTTDAFKSE